MGTVNIKQSDKAGNRSKRIELATDTDAAANAIAGAIDVITGGSVKQVDRTIALSSESGYGTGNLGREVVFVFKNADGKALPMRIRGVLDDYILQGGAIDITHADIIAFASAVMTNARLSDGETAATLYEGYVVD